MIRFGLLPLHGSRTLKISLVGGLVCGIGSCASYTDTTKEMHDAYRAGNYDRALDSLKQSGVMEKSQDRLLWRLEAATILDRKGDVDKSRSLWMEADSVADELYTLSISKTATSFIMSDASSDYDGEDYEKVAIHSMLAHQYIGIGKMDDARVEARKINNKLTEINQKYDEKSKNQYGEDAHARYLSGTIYEARSEWDSAIIDYSKALELYEGAFSHYIRGPVPRGLVLSLKRLLQMRNRTDRLKALSEKYKAEFREKSDNDDGEIAVVHEVGMISRKVAKEFLLPIGGQVVRFSFPVLEPRQIFDVGTGVEVKNLGFFKAENTEYLDAIAHDTLENRRARTVAKQMARLLLKGQLNYQAEKKFGILGGIAMNVFTAATETADTRSWTTLPQAFYMSRVRLAPGEYDIAIKTNGRVNSTKHITVKRGQIQLFRGVE